MNEDCNKLEIIESFQAALKENSSSKQNALYKGEKSLVTPDTASKQPISALEVISNVAKQLKAIYNADCMRGTKKGLIISKHKQSTFLPINNLCVNEEKLLPQKQKFETQHFTDTQLINVVEDVEAQYVQGMEQGGMTQEFEMSFCQTHVEENNGDTDLNPEIPTNKEEFTIVDITLKDESTELIQSPNLLEDDEHTQIPQEILEIDDVQVEHDTQLENCTQILNECIEIEDFDDRETVIRPSSPILSIKSKTPRSNRASPLVFNLETFEKFEKIAQPVLEEVADCEIAKQMIDSQILGQELFVNMNSEPFFKEIDQMSPIIEFNKDVLKIDKSIVFKNKNTNSNKHELSKCNKETITTTGQSKSNEDSSSDKSVFKDEILFSSDEEDDNVHKTYLDLPFTCALETSFYDESKILDKTMFVGFQTASDKCIEVKTESFYKAQSLLDDIEQDLNSECSLNDLVKAYDCSKEINYNSDSVQAENKAIHTVQNIQAENKGAGGDQENETEDEYAHLDFICLPEKEISTDLFKEMDNTSINLSNEGKVSVDTAKLKEQFQGFKTASNKLIVLSEKALSKSKSMFNDILDENLESITNRSLTDKIGDKTDLKESEKESIQTHIDEEILQEFQQDLDCSEFEKKHKEPKFVGFKTAKNENIKISETALAKTKKIFQNIDFDEKFEINVDNDAAKLNKPAVFDKSNDNKTTISLKTACNSDIKITDKAKLNRNYEEKMIAPQEYVNKPLELRTNKDFNQPSTSDCLSFKTASNKIIKISEQAIKNTIKLFRDIDDNLFTKPTEKVDTKETAFTGFKTASNKKVYISNQSLAKSKNVFKDIEKDFDADNLYDDKEPPFFGFKQTEHTELFDVLAKSQKIFEKLGVTKKPELNNVELEEKAAKFIGFQTASRKPVQISAAALAKSKKLFQNLDASVVNDDSSAISANFDELQTNNNKKVKIGEEVRSNDTSEKKSASILKRNYDSPISNSFQTPNNDIVEANEVLVKSNIFKDAVSHQYNKENITEEGQEIMKFKGFLTANDKQVNISAATLARSRKIFQDIDCELDLANKRKISNTNEVKMTESHEKFTGFKTASEKTIKMSDKALLKSKTMFQDIFDQNFQAITDTEYKPIEKESPKIHTNESDIKNWKIKGFQTANNKEVTISEEALSKSKHMFKDIDNYKPEVKDNLQFTGFQTANNKHVTVSEKALAKSRKMLEDIHNSDVEKEDIRFKGFQTGNNETVEVSAEALAKGRGIFKVTANEKGDKIEEKFDRPIKTFIGFQTANNKHVKVSEEALIKSKILLQDVDNFDNGTNSVTFKGFQTASKKNVIISEDALIKSRMLFQDIDVSEFECDKNDNNAINSNKIKQGFPFKTASNSNIQISKEALLKSKKVLNENDENGPLMPNKNVDEIKYTESEAKDYTDNIINTQVLHNFEMTLHSEDFLKDTTPKSKRSGSPILSCPKAKKRKIFQTPYSQKTIDPKEKVFNFVAPKIVAKSSHIIQFNSDYKKDKKYSLKDLQRLENTATNFDQSIDSYISNATYENLDSFEFSAQRNELTQQKINTQELKTIFLDSVNRKIVPEGWLDIHIKLIIWKLLCYEIKFPKTMRNTCTAKTVLQQLKYRYDIELYNAQRPALRKILEKDDTSLRTLVLCVVEIHSANADSTTPELLLTDGWYCIRTIIDKMLAKQLALGRITVGTKLVTHGAELVGSEQPMEPWENTSTVRLKIFGNSTRRARWDTRLGYHSNGAILSQLSTVSPDGGKISKLRVYVTRIYPALYVEKFEDGSTVTRSERLENIHQMKYENERQSLLEKLYEEVEKEIQEQESQDSDMETGYKRKSLESGSQMSKIMKRNTDHCEFRSHLTASQTELLDNHTSRKREKILQDIQDKVQSKMAKCGLNVGRNVIPLLKIRVASIEERNSEILVTKAMISIWKPNDAITEILKEGVWIEMMNIVPTAIRYSEIQISAGRQSVFSISKYKESQKCKPYTTSLKRTVYPIKDLVKNPSVTTDYNEIDTVGIVFQIEPTVKEFDSAKNQFQNVYLTDAEKNIVCINFWGGLKKFGFENALDTGQIVAGTNLQKRAGNTRKTVPHYRATEFSYFTKTPKSETARKAIEELSKTLYGIDRRKFVEQCIDYKNNYISKLKTNENVTPYRISNMEVNSSKNKIFIDSPLTERNKIDENLNLTGLDFESTFRQVDTQELSPRTFLRKRQINEKIAKLRMYGNPPPLSPIQIINKSKNAGNAFKSPLATKSDVSLSILASDKKILPNQEEVQSEEIQCSPVISLNRTYVKRTNVNPVKLNFSNVAISDNSLSEIVDDFAEEFDGSPPLSLD